MRFQTFLKAAALSICVASPAPAAELDMKPVNTIFARTPAQSDGVYRYGFPRSDLKVVLDGVTIKPALALGGWVAFKAMDGNAMIMGDLVLTESEINPVMAKLLESGIEVTALHNHLLRAVPATFYMHVGGRGDPVKMAEALRSALALTGVSFAPPPPESAPPPIDLDTAKIDEAMSAKGKANGGVYQFGVPRADKVTMADMVIPSAMGSADVINFQPTGGGKAAITGDIVALANEVVPLITAMRANNIEVTAIHNHMIDDDPRAFFIHFWAHDDALKLAQGIRMAIEKTNVAHKAAP